ncbi:MAG: DUF2974 domain-containing protein [Atopobiaceae bacterium]|nr:DUF2974 domain-containing protein [Atopobiaceae bacterium]
MANIIDYVLARREGFDELPLNRVDSLVLSWVCYVTFPQDSPVRTPQGQTLAEAFGNGGLVGMTASMHDPTSTQLLLSAVAASPRFGDVVARLHLERASKADETQFSGTAFSIPGGGTYVGYRGTDNTLVGWKEDFNMAFRAPVPAQATATAYLQIISEQVDGPLWVGGHSKGGNLAVYATMMVDAPIRERILRCFSHDGPGFIDEVTSDPRWAGAYELVDKTVPEESIIGLLLENAKSEPYIVESSSKSVMQHAPFSWVVDGLDFKSGGAVSYESYRKNKRLNSWMRQMSVEDRERFIEVLYKLAQATGEVTFSGLAASVRDGSLSLVLRRLDGMDESDRTFFIGALDELVATMLLGPAPKQATTNAEAVDIASDRIDDITAQFNDTMDKWSKYFG